MDIDNIDELFVSERDGQPFKIRWGMVSRVRGPSQPVIFEAEGVEGKRQVGFTSSKMQEVDSAEYDRLWTVESDDLSAPQSDRGEPDRPESEFLNQPANRRLFFVGAGSMAIMTSRLVQGPSKISRNALRPVRWFRKTWPSAKWYLYWISPSR